MTVKSKLMFKKPGKFKPFYKKFIDLRENPHRDVKLLKFKKKKWKSFIFFCKSNLKWFKRFIPRNQENYVISQFSNRHSGYRNRYKNTMQTYKTFNFFYGNVGKKTIKNKIFKLKRKNVKNLKRHFLELCEKRIDIVLYRARFCCSLRHAQQLLLHGKILVNNKVIKAKSHELVSGDLVSFDLKDIKWIQRTISKRRILIWPVPPKHLVINYKTMQFIVNSTEHVNLSTMFTYYMNLEKIVLNLPKH